MSNLFEHLSGNEVKNSNYDFFRYQQERQELFEYSKTIAEYLRSEKIADLVIVDRSSRPLYIGVKEYLQVKYPDEALPGIFFVNPKGFKAQEDLTAEEVDEIIYSCEWQDDLLESPDQVRGKEKILTELRDVYQKLTADKDKPVLLFDTCIHSGDSLAPVRDIMKQAGFSDLRIGAINPAEAGSSVKTDFFVTTEEPEKGCYPFDRDRIIEKTFDHVYSKKTDDPEKREKSLALRREIKKIIDEYLSKKYEQG